MPLFTAFNAHPEDSGPAPSLSTRDRGYHGYFENRHGEQWIFVKKGDEAVLYGGDVGWENVHRVVEGRADGLNLNKGERQWLAACWSAAFPEDG